MARYRKIEPRIWGDEKFASMDPLEKLVWFALLTHPMMTPMGAGVMPAGVVDEILGNDRGGWCWKCGDTCGLPEHSAEGILQRLTERSMILRDNSLIIVKNYLLQNAPDNPNQLAGWIESCEELPRSDKFRELYRYLLKVMKGEPAWLFDGLLKPLAQKKPRRLKELYWERVREHTSKPSLKGSAKGSGKRSGIPSGESGTGTGTGKRSLKRRQEEERGGSPPPSSPGRTSKRNSKTKDPSALVNELVEKFNEKWKQPWDWWRSRLQAIQQRTWGAVSLTDEELLLLVNGRSTGKAKFKGFEAPDLLWLAIARTRKKPKRAFPYLQAIARDQDSIHRLQKLASAMTDNDFG